MRCIYTVNHTAASNKFFGGGWYATGPGATHFRRSLRLQPDYRLPAHSVVGRLVIVTLLSVAAWVPRVIHAQAVDGTWSELPGPSRSGATAIIDSLRDRVVVFGGTDGQTTFDDVWVFPFSGVQRWQRLAVNGTGPGPRT